MSNGMLHLAALFQRLSPLYPSYPLGGDQSRWVFGPPAGIYASSGSRSVKQNTGCMTDRRAISPAAYAVRSRSDRPMLVAERLESWEQACRPRLSSGCPSDFLSGNTLDGRTLYLFAAALSCIAAITISGSEVPESSRDQQESNERPSRLIRQSNLGGMMVARISVAALPMAGAAIAAITLAALRYQTVLLRASRKL